MGYGLTIFPLRGPRDLEQGSERCISVLCYDCLSFDQDYSIFGQLIDLSVYRKDGRKDIPNKPTIKTNPIPALMWIEIWQGEHTERTREDRYGTELTFVYAQQLKKLKILKNASPKNKAIKAFVDALPDEIPIILYWH